MITYIDIKKICPHPSNPRKHLGDLTELAESIKTSGILQNLTVVPWVSTITGSSSDNQEVGPLWTVVIGHRRLAAAKLAGLTEVPCVISDMDHRTQVATMLLENMQRSDLTVYEQAQGFQMMINLGETLEGISKATGFSEATVRRRVKLLELDDKKFVAAQERGGTLMDYAALEQIEDSTLKNKVLEYIGTDNFKWKLQEAIKQEKTEKWQTEAIPQFEQFAEKVEEYPSGMSYIKNYNTGMQIEVPEDAEERKYAFKVAPYGISLYKEYDNERGVEVDEGLAQKNKLREERKNKLDEITKNAFVLRRDFVKNYNGAKKDIPIILEFAVKCAILACDDFESEFFLNLMGIEVPEGAEDDYDAIENLVKEFSMEKMKENPSKTALAALYSNIGDNKNAGYYDYWQHCHKENEILDITYDTLISLGYKMSDEEQALRDGTHELFGEV